MKGYNVLKETYALLEANLLDDALYLQGLAEKGMGAGTDIGYAMDKFEKYLDLATAGTNVFNECDVDYYMIALSKATSNVSGFCQQAVNTYWRISSDEQLFTDLQTALDNTDQATAA